MKRPGWRRAAALGIAAVAVTAAACVGVLETRYHRFRAEIYGNLCARTCAANIQAIAAAQQAYAAKTGAYSLDDGYEPGHAVGMLINVGHELQAEPLCPTDHSHYSCVQCKRDRLHRDPLPECGDTRLGSPLDDRWRITLPPLLAKKRSHTETNLPR